MSTLKLNNLQLGQSATATQNFAVTPGGDGTAKLARGNVGSTSQDILTINSGGVVNFPVGVTAPTLATTDSSTNVATTAFVQSKLGSLSQSLGVNGYQTLPGGLILQWGTATSNGSTINFPIAFPTNVVNIQLTSYYPGNPSLYATEVTSVSNSGFTAYNGSNSHTIYWLAIGY